MYILKTKGTNTIPDYIQIRDDSFILLSHFKANSHVKALKKFGFIKNKRKIIELIMKMSFGILQRIDYDAS